MDDALPRSDPDRPAPSRPTLSAVAVRLVGVTAAVLLLGVSPVPGVLVGSVQEAHRAAAAGDHLAEAAAYRVASTYEPWVDSHLAGAVQAALQGSDFAQAEEDLARLAARRPLAAEELLWWGAVYAGQGEEDEALAAWERAWQAGAADPKSLQRLTGAYLDRGDLAGARRALETLSAAGVPDVDLLRRLAMLEAFDQPQQAIVTLDRAATLGGDAARYEVLVDALSAGFGATPDLRFTQLGVAFLDLGELELAAAAFERAALTNPAYGEALAYLGYARLLRGEPALGAMHQAVRLSPGNPKVHMLAGLAWEAQARSQEARAAFERAHRLDPQNPAIHVEIAGTHRAQHQLASAELWLQEAVRVSGNQLAFRRLLAEFYVDEGYRLEEAALPLLEALVEEAPDDAELRAALAWAHFQLGELELADAGLTQALRLDPGSARANAHMGALLESQGRTSEAVTHYRRAQTAGAGGPFGVFAARALERLDE